MVNPVSGASSPNEGTNVNPVQDQITELLKMGDSSTHDDTINIQQLSHLVTALTSQLVGGGHETAEMSNWIQTNISDPLNNAVDNTGKVLDQNALQGVIGKLLSASCFGVKDHGSEMFMPIMSTNNITDEKVQDIHERLNDGPPVVKGKVDNHSWYAHLLSDIQ